MKNIKQLKNRIKLQTHHCNQGFSLVELSIVLVILGLLTGGILSGQSLIKAAELRAIPTEKDRIQSAVMIFQTKYLGVPGDLNNATSFWGTMPTGTCNNSAAGASGGNGIQTCNGNGDGQVTEGIAVVNSNIETALFWQHLANAGLVEGKYDGIFYNNGAQNQEMASKYAASTLWRAAYIQNYSAAATNIFEGENGNTLNLYTGSGSYQSTLTPSDAWNIDKKTDDGLPGTGSLTTYEYNGVNCNTLAASATAASNFTYNLTNNSVACNLVFRKLW